MNANDLLAFIDREVKEVEVSGGKVYVRSLTAGEQLDLQVARDSAGESVKDLLAHQLAAYLCDEQGQKLLTVEQAQKFLANRKPETIKAITSTASKLNGWDKEEQDAIRGN